MRIYAVADIHGRMDRLRRIRAVVFSHRPHVLVVAGDVINYIRPEKTFQALDQLGLPVLMVRGNSDPGRVEARIPRFGRLQSLHLHRVVVNAIPFTGLSGTLPLPFRNRIRVFEKSLMEKARPLVDPETVLVVHAPPRGACDQVAGRFASGSQMVRDLVENAMPRLVICGHIHEDAGVSSLGKTLVVNCALPKTGKGVMIEIGEGKTPAVEMV